MRELLTIPAFAPVAYVAQNSVFTPENFPLWERLLEKWGIGMIGLVLFGMLAYWTYRKEEKATVKRDKKDEEFQQERAKLLSENNELTRKMLENSFSHTANLEKLLHASNETFQETRLELRYLGEAVKSLASINHNTKE